MDRGDMNSVVFLDIRKAFDTVNHQILLDKLHCYDVGDGEPLFFRSYLQNRTQCCSVNGQISTLLTGPVEFCKSLPWTITFYYLYE